MEVAVFECGSYFLSYKIRKEGNPNQAQGASDDERAGDADELRQASAG